MLRTLFAAVLTATLLPTHAGVPVQEGMWLPTEARSPAVFGRLVAAGLAVTPDDIWNPGHPSLSDAMVMVGSPSDDLSEGIDGYGSASFVSGDGLILTNHHVAFDALAALATPESNFVENGFVAKTRADERPCPGLAVQITTGIEDVTGEVDAGNADLSEPERDGRVQQRILALLQRRRAAGSPHCTVKSMRGGTRWILFVYDVLRDVRMVHAPCRSLGEFGGDIDNWMWPRHCADYTYLRAYVAPDGQRVPYAADNVPFRPRRHLKVSVAGIQPGDFTFIMGHPGTTYRYRSSHSVAYWRDLAYPAQIRAIRERLSQLERAAAESPARALEVASEIKSFNNTLKNFEGTVEALARLKVAERRAEDEVAMQRWVDRNPERQARYGRLFEREGQLYAALRTGRPEAQRTFQMEILGLRRKYADLLAEYDGSEPFSDANMTLRVTGGVVGGYQPRDGVRYEHITTLEGLLDKDTGTAPFDCPEEVRKKIAAKDWGRWADASLGRLFVNFLTDTDITGGNSGSPIMNARGELIGLAFDGTLDAITSDFLFEDFSRTISVDVRYVLWCTERVYGLDRLVTEMGL